MIINFFWKKAISLWLHALSEQDRRDSFFYKTLFRALCLAEFFYRIIFRFHQKMRFLTGGFSLPNYSVISVGNISLGGTGKSVFCLFLLKQIDNPVLILRGYGSKRKKHFKETIFFHNQTVPQDLVDMLGDEALVYIRWTRVPVVVGPSRKQALKKTALFLNQAKKYTVVLDDAYQNHALKKNHDILLVDGRMVQLHNRCFPAGTLREKNVARATMIIVTHAKESAQFYKSALVSYGLRSSQLLLRARHRFSFISDCHGNKISLASLNEKKIFACAGIGSFDQFMSTCREQAELTINGSMEFPDHYVYTAVDLAAILNAAREKSCSAIITTTKDWVKLDALIQEKKDYEWLILHVEFEFLTTEEYSDFRKALRLN